MTKGKNISESEASRICEIASNAAHMNWNELKAKIPTTIRYSIALSNYYCVEREWALRAILISSKFCAGLSKCRIDTSNGWVEMLNSYICIVDQPSSNKTGAINMISELLSSTYQLAQLVQTQRLNEASAQTPPDWVTWKVNHFTEEIDTKTETDLQDVLSSFSNTSLSTEEISMSQEQHNQLNEDQAQTDIISQADMLSQPAEDSDDDSASLYEDDPYRPRYCLVENQESFSSPGKTYNFRPTSMTDVRVNMADYPVRLLKIDELPNLVSALKSNSPLEYLIEAKQGIAMAAIIEEENSRKKIKKVAEKTNLNIITSCQYLPFVLFLEEYAASGLSLRFEYILAPSHSKKTHERYIGPELNFYDMLKKIFSKIFLSHHFCPNGSPELLNLEHKYRLPISIEEQSRSHYTHTAYLFVKLASSTKPVNLLQTAEITLLKDLITRECQCGIREKQVFSQLLLELGKLHSVGDWDLGLSHEDFEQSIKKVSVEDFALRVLKACAIPCNSLKVQYGENLSKYEVVEYKDSIFFQDIKGKENSGDVLSQFDKEIDELVGSKRLPRLTRGFLGKSSGKVVSNAVALELIERANTMTVKELLHCKTEISTTSVEAAIMIQQIQNVRIGRVDCELLKRESKLQGVPEKYKINKQTNLPWLVMKKASSVQNNVLSAVPTLLDPECNRDNAVNIILYPGKNVPLEYAKVLTRNCTQQDFQKMGCDLVNAGLGKFKKVPYHAESVRT